MSVSETVILFQNERISNPEISGGWVTRQVNRESGEHLVSIDVGSIHLRKVGTCERAPFTGFPARRF
jgi:hypothetical protein